MTLRSVINRIFNGPTVHKLVCYRLTKTLLDKCDYHCWENIVIEELNAESCDKVLAIRENDVKCAFECMVKDSMIILAKWRGKIAGHAVLKPSGKKENCEAFWKEKNYIHYCYVDPKYRGNGIYPFMLVYLADKLFRMQTEQVLYISADNKNDSSIRGIQKAGFQYWGTLMEYGWGGIIFFRRFKKEKGKEN